MAKAHRQSFGPRGTVRGLRTQLEKGCPSCGCIIGVLPQSSYDFTVVACRMCGDMFRSATGDYVGKLHDSAILK